MLKPLSKSFLISVCMVALAIGLVLQSLVSHNVSQPTANGGSKEQHSGSPQTGTGERSPAGYWMGTVRLESGEIIPLYEIQLFAGDGHISGNSNGSYSGGYKRISTEGLLEGKYNDANSFDFTLDYNYPSETIGYEDAARRNTQIMFDGQATGDTAEGTVIFIDEFGNKFNGTFAFVRERKGVDLPTPKDPGGSSISLINGKWQGQFVGQYHGSRYSLNLALHQQSQLSPVIIGTATMNGQQVEVEGNVAGSSFNLKINNSIPYLIVGGKVTQNTMQSVGEIYTEQPQGIENPRPSDYGKVVFTR